MMLPKLIATLAISNSADAVRVTARSPRTPVTMRSSTGDSLKDVARRASALGQLKSSRSDANAIGSLGRPRRGPLGRIRYDFIGIVKRGFWPRHVFADAGDGLHQCRLFRRRQADQFAAAGGPCCAGLVEEIQRSRIDRHHLGGGVLVDDLLQVRR